MATFQELLETIKKESTITIWGHAIPDGDCYGSQIGLREILRANFPNKKVYAIGSGIPALFSRLSPMDSVDEETIASSLAILVDVSCLRRVEDKRVFLAKKFAKFDHHDPNKRGEDFPYPDFCVDPRKIACAELIENFAFFNHLKLTKLAAEALYTGIFTDSGCFRFYGTNQGTFQAVRRLAKEGIDPLSIRAILERESENVRRFKAFLRSKVQKTKDVTYVIIGPKDYLSFGLSFEEAGSFVNAIESVESPNIYCLFVEDGKGEYRGELRSNKGYPVQPTATHFHGGGHLFASGTSTYSEEECRKVVEELTRVKKLPL
mgnify:FL=1